ncbi:flagellar hook-length control protein FliK [Thalassospira sp.]|uniref:flagellar hook-length control protein FliK n=1 Tax=Thalassospira sp. TaxID=1912094 RepID=UPI002736B125|nr:flagellar hook-length control protein FliK [Thalassospira sp.]MDP2696653.1 flagellar hook-length control protein FliK [Thalassospira sp.]
MHSSAIDKTLSTTLAAPAPQPSASNGIAFTDVMDQINAGRADARDKRTQTPANNADSRSSRDDDRARAARQDDRAARDASRTTSNDRDQTPARDTKTSRPDDHDNTRTAPKNQKDTVTASDDKATAPETVAEKPAEGTPSVETVQNDPSAPVIEDTANSTGSKTESEAKTDDTPVDATVIAMPAPPVAQTPAELALALAAAQQGGTTIPSNLNTGDETGMATGMAGDAGAKSTLMASTALSQTAPVSPVSTAATGTKSSTPGNIGPADVADSFDALVNTRATLTGQPASAGSESGGNTGNGSNNSNSQSGTTGQNPAATGNGTAQATPNNLVGMANVPAAANTTAQQPAATVATAANSTLAANSVTGTDSLGQVTLGNTNAGTSTGANNLAGQTAQTARNAPTQQVQQQVAVHIRNAASDGVDRISVQLRPESLGRVDIKMEISHDGRVQTVIQADNRETLDLLRQDVRGLQQALKDAGLNADSQSFTFEHRQGGSGQEQDGRNQATGSGKQLPDEGDILTGAELAEHVAIGYGINPNGLVDIRI